MNTQTLITLLNLPISLGYIIYCVMITPKVSLDALKSLDVCKVWNIYLYVCLYVCMYITVNVKLCRHKFQVFLLSGNIPAEETMWRTIRRGAGKTVSKAAKLSVRSGASPYLQMFKQHGMLLLRSYNHLFLLFSFFIHSELKVSD